MPRVEAICTSASKGERKGPSDRATFLEGHGIEGDAHAGAWHRQVSLLGAEDIDTVRKNGLPDIVPGAFAENVVVSGLKLESFGLGTRLRLGRDVVLSVTQIGKVCHSPCRIYHLTGDCIMPRLGLFARVEAGGEVVVGDDAGAVRIIPRDRTQAVVLLAAAPEAAVDGAAPKMPEGAARLLEMLKAHVYALESTPTAEAMARRLEHYCDGHSIDLVVVAEGAEEAGREWVARVTRQALKDPAQNAGGGLPIADACTEDGASWGVIGSRGGTLLATASGPPLGDDRLSDLTRAVEHELGRLRLRAADAAPVPAAGGSGAR
jgi:MOSC domain-containing protein YiiM